MHSCLYLLCQVFLYVNEDVTANMHVSECVSDNVLEFPHVHEYACGNVQADVLCLCAYEHVHLYLQMFIGVCGCHCMYVNVNESCLDNVHVHVT